MSCKKSAAARLAKRFTFVRFLVCRFLVCRFLVGGLLALVPSAQALPGLTLTIANNTDAKFVLYRDSFSNHEDKGPAPQVIGGNERGEILVHASATQQINGEIAYLSQGTYEGCLVRVSAFPHNGMYKFNVTTVMLSANTTKMNCQTQESHDPETGEASATLTISQPPATSVTAEGKTSAVSPLSP